MNPIGAIIKFLLARLTEPSSHAGLAGLFGALALIFPQYGAVLQIIAAVFGGNAALMPDAKPAAAAAPANEIPKQLS